MPDSVPKQSPKIWLFGGTSEGRLLAEHLSRLYLPALVSVVGDYGASLLESSDYLTVLEGAQPPEAILERCQQENIDLLVDATHPFAQHISETLRRISADLQIPLLRVSRQSESLQLIEGERLFSSFEELKEALHQRFQEDSPPTVFSTLGMKSIPELVAIPGLSDRLWIRILPSIQSLQMALDAGIPASRIVSLQGPFSQDVNEALFRMSSATLVLTKDSGSTGGFQEKRLAAKASGCELWIIQRPQEEGASLQEAIRQLDRWKEEAESCLNADKADSEKPILTLEEAVAPEAPPVTILGLGASPSQLTQEALEELSSADLVLGAQRMIQSLASYLPENPSPELFVSYKPEEIGEKIRSSHSHHPVVVVSGDVGFYSLAESIQNRLKDHPTRLIPGIASPIAFYARLGRPWQNVVLASLHGRDCPVASLIRRHPEVCFLLGSSVGELVQSVEVAQLSHVTFVLGERIGYPDEAVTPLSLDELKGHSLRSPALISVINPSPQSQLQVGIPDEQWIRGSRPMTKSPVRAQILSALHLSETDCCWDVGCGTGSVSIEMALNAWRGQVWAFDCEPEAIRLTQENGGRFHVDNLHTALGKAPEVLSQAPKPDAVFVGGGGQDLPAILESILAKAPTCRLVATAILPESLTRLTTTLKRYPSRRNRVSLITGAEGRPTECGHLFSAYNPIYLIQSEWVDPANEQPHPPL